MWAITMAARAAYSQRKYHFVVAWATAQCLYISGGCSTPSWPARPVACDTRVHYRRVLCSHSMLAYRESQD